ncbi:MAG: zinc-binding dehydrogenase [Alphaproteobacteria bacterium]
MKQFVLRHKLNAAPMASDFKEIEVDRPQCPVNGILVIVKFISVDPYVGHQLNVGHMGMQPPAPCAEMIPGGIVGEVIESNSSKARKGDHVHAESAGGWAEFCVLDDSQYTIIDPEAAPLSAYTGILGMPGLTAWASVTQLACVRAGDVVSVNAAAGPVGGAVGQFSRMKGAKSVIGIAGGKEKCTLVEDLYGFDACIDYKSEDWQDNYSQAAPDGISVHHENVGAEQLDFAMKNLRLNGRIVLCGLAAHYHESEPATTLLGPIVGKRATVRGLVVYDYYDRWDEFRAEVAPWVKSGKVKISEEVANGLSAGPELMEKLMTGKNIGKCVIKL